MSANYQTCFTVIKCLQVEIVGQLSGQMADMVMGVVETVGEEPEPEGIPEQHEDEEEELTKVTFSRLKDPTLDTALS